MQSATNTLLDCDACGTRREASVVTSGGMEYGEPGSCTSWCYSLLKCASCGMGKLVPLPTKEALRAMYASDYFTYQPVEQDAPRRVGRWLKMGIARGGALRYRLPAGPMRLAVKGLVSVLELLGARTVPLTTSFPLSLPGTASILDYGCGSGWWLEQMRRQGYTRLWGYDVDQPMLANLRKVGIRVCVEPESLPATAFDCVRLEHVLEHLTDPLAVLSAVRESLRPGGSLVLAVPDFGAWSSDTRLPEDANLSLPHHLLHFTQGSLEMLATRAGLDVVEVQHLPIWQVAQGALRSARMASGRPPPRGSGRLWRLRYHAWARTNGRGDYLAMRLVPR